MSNPFSTPERDDFLLPERRRERLDPLIPMINIVFLMLTFFMIAGTFQAAEVLDVDPPEVASDGNPSEEGPIILIDRDGIMALRGETLDRDALVARLKQQLKKAPAEVRLKADRAARVYFVLPLLKALSDNGINQVQLIAVSR